MIPGDDIPSIPKLADEFFQNYQPDAVEKDPSLLLSQVDHESGQLKYHFEAWFGYPKGSEVRWERARTIEAVAASMRRYQVRYLNAWKPGLPVPTWAVECQGARPDGSIGEHIRPLADPNAFHVPLDRNGEGMWERRRSVREPAVQEHEELVEFVGRSVFHIVAGETRDEYDDEFPPEAIPRMYR